LIGILTNPYDEATTVLEKILHRSRAFGKNESGAGGLSYELGELVSI
jgi:hypothetical protein